MMARRIKGWITARAVKIFIAVGVVLTTTTVMFLGKKRFEEISFTEETQKAFERKAQAASLQKKKVNNSTFPKVRMEAEVIVLKPGKTIALKINDKEWSPWIDASRKGLYSYAHAPKGIVFMFRNGAIVTIGDGEGNKIFPSSSQYLVYRLKSPDGSGSQLAIIEASNEPIIE